MVTFSCVANFSCRVVEIKAYACGIGTQKMVYTDFEGAWVKPFYSPEGELLGTVDRQDTIEVWNIEGREKLYTRTAPAEY